MGNNTICGRCCECKCASGVSGDEDLVDATANRRRDRDAGRLIDLINQLRADIHHCLTSLGRVRRRMRRALAVDAHRVAVTDFNVTEQPYRFLGRAGRLGNLDRRSELERLTAGIEPLAVDTFSVAVLVLGFPGHEEAAVIKRCHRGVGLRCFGLRINPEIFPDSYALLIINPSVDAGAAAVLTGIVPGNHKAAGVATK